MEPELELQFPKLKLPTVFLASPGDVKALRADINQAFHERMASTADPEQLDLYIWEEAFCLAGFDHYKPAESQIPLASDANCKAVLCLFGERVGKPLTAWDKYRGFFGNWKDSPKGRLVMPWEPGAEKSGGFALTGTIFEILVAMHANRESRYTIDGTPPYRILFFGDGDLLSAEPLRANWGQRLLEKRIQSIQDRDLQDEELAEHRSQIQQLINFRYFLEENEIFVGEDAVAKSPEDAVKKCLHFLTSHGLLNSGGIETYPFKGLSHYDIKDSNVFFGRHAWIQEAIAAFNAAWSSRPNSRLDRVPGPFFAIKGGSGSGKSSLLRAGLLGRLERVDSLYLTVCVVISATDLLSSALRLEHRHANKPLERLVAYVIEELDRRANLPPVGIGVSRYRFHPAGIEIDDAVERVVAALGGIHRPPGRVTEPRLIIGLDQFELLLDRHESEPELIEPLFVFVREACASGSIGFVYTCQTNRLDALRQNPILTQINRSAGRYEDFGRTVDKLSVETFVEIAERSFEVIHVELDKPVLTALQERAKQFVNRVVSIEQQRDEDITALLPLFSLSLERLANLCRAYRQGTLEEWLLENKLAGKSTLASPEDATPGQPPHVLAGDQILVLRADEIPEELLQVEKAIEAQANLAFERAKEFAGVTRETLSQMLRRLVRMQSRSKFELLTTEPPEWGPLRLLMQQLQTDRLLVPSGTQLHLVHEAVLTHWTPARDWLERERPLLIAAHHLKPFVELWMDTGEVPQLLPEQIKQIGLLLLNWHDVFRPTDGTAVSERNRSLLEFALAVLSKPPLTPELLVESEDAGSNHFLLATYYGWLDLVRSYLAENQELARSAKTLKNSRAANMASRSGDPRTLELVLEAGADPVQPNEDGWRAIHGAAMIGSLECLEMLVARGADVNVATGVGSTPLMIAVVNGRSNMVQHLLSKYGCRVDTPDNDSRCALQNAANMGHTRILKLLLARPEADPARADKEGWSAFHMACAGHIPEAVDLFLADSRTQIKQLKGEKATPLHLALAYATPEVIQALLRNDKVSRDPWGSTTLLALAIGRGLPFVKVLLDDPHPPAKPPEGGDAMLQLAVAQRNLPLIRMLLDAGVDPDQPDSNGWTPIVLAARRNYGEVLTVLLGPSGHMAIHPPVGSILGTGLSPLHVAAFHGAEASVQVLLHYSFEPALTGLKDKDGDTALHIAAARSNLAVVKSLASPRPFARFRRMVGADDQGVDEEGINSKNNAGDTPLHIAAALNDVPIVRLLLERGAATELLNEQGKTPLLCALRNTSVEAALVLLDHNAKINVADKAGWTALHFAVSRNLETVRTRIIEQGNKVWPGTLAVNHKTGEGVTPLHMAAALGDLETMRALFAEGAAVELQDKDGRTPLLAAVAAGQSQAFDLLFVEKRAHFDVTDNEGFNCLHLAIQRDLEAVYERLLVKSKMRDAITKDGQTAVHVAARHNRVKALGALKRAGAARDLPDVAARTPLLVALRQGAAEAARWLIENGANTTQVDTTGATVLHAASQEPMLEILLLLLAKQRSSINMQDAKGLTALHVAAARKDDEAIETVNALLTAEPMLELRDRDERTPLLTALAVPSAAVAGRLLAQGADPMAVDKKGWTILHAAAHSTLDALAAEWLATGRFDVNAQTLDRLTPLHLAAKAGSVELVRRLLEVDGIDANAADVDGRTPLHLAAQNDQANVAAVLLQSSKVNKMAVSKTRRTALHYAAQTDAVSVCSMLREVMTDDDLGEMTNGLKTAEDLARLNGFDRIVAILRKHETN